MAEIRNLAASTSSDCLDYGDGNATVFSRLGSKKTVAPNADHRRTINRILSSSRPPRSHHKQPPSLTITRELNTDTRLVTKSQDMNVPLDNSVIKIGNRKVQVGRMASDLEPTTPGQASASQSDHVCIRMSNLNRDVVESDVEVKTLVLYKVKTC